jgi:hypothetical protein
MESKDERRKRKLVQLVGDKGGVKPVALAAGLAWETLDQVLKGTPLPAKKDGTCSPRSLGDPAAEAIEDAYDLGRGWFDWPFDLVDHRDYWSLPEPKRHALQDRMAQEIAKLKQAPPPRAGAGAIRLRLTSGAKKSAPKKKPKA